MSSSAATSACGPDAPRTVEQNDLLDPARRRAYLDLLQRGASPALACRQMGIDYLAVMHALRHSSEFREQLVLVQELLAQNVSAALYKSALDGKVSAQMFYLRQFSGRPADQRETDRSDGFDELSDEELQNLLNQLSLGHD